MAGIIEKIGTEFEQQGKLLEKKEAEKSVLNQTTSELKKKITSLENLAYKCAKKQNGDLSKKDKMFK